MTNNYADEVAFWIAEAQRYADEGDHSNRLAATQQARAAQRKMREQMFAYTLGRA